MKTKKMLYSEMAYALGLVILALGTAFMERADFGLSMVVAPAYLLHLRISQSMPAFTFGMAEYCFQAMLLIVMAIVLRRFKTAYLFSFVTAVIYGLTLDAAMKLIGFLPETGFLGRMVDYVVGMLGCSIGVSLLFHTYIPPEAYELFVKEISARLGVRIHIVKTIYDCVSCLAAVALSFAFFGLWHFEGVKLGTAICAMLNGFVISRCSRMLESRFQFKDAFVWRKKFEA